MKRLMVCALAAGMAGATVGARADGTDCCRPPATNGAACCPAGQTGGKICLEVKDGTAVELAKQMSEVIGCEVRLQGPGFERITLKLCAPTPEAAMAQAAAALHGRWRHAFIIVPGPAADHSALDGPVVTVVFRNAATSTAAYVTAARAGSVIIADKPLTGRVSFEGKEVPAGKILDAIAAAAGVNWKPAFVLQTGPESTVVRREGTSKGSGAGSVLKLRPDSPLSHLHRGPLGGPGVAPAPGMIVKDPEALTARLEEEAMRRQQLGEWAGVFTQETPREVKRAIRDLRIRVETAIQKLESYPPQNRELGAAFWRARYERMLEDYTHLTPDQQKQVQPVLDAMKYFAAPAVKN